MKITRRFAVASLLVIAVAIVLGAPAPAFADHRTQVTLYPAADSPSPNATGKVTLSGNTSRMYYDRVSVSVSKLAPNASYYMLVTVVTANGPSVLGVGIQTDARGKGEGVLSSNHGPYGYYIVPQSSFQVYGPPGTLVLTTNP